MGAIWFGLEIGLGIAIGLSLVYYAWRDLRAISRNIRAISRNIRALRFQRAGFDWAKGPQGWLSRDPHNGNWILWDERTNQMFRATPPGGNWRPSEERLEQCLALGRRYRADMRF